MKRCSLVRVGRAAVVCALLTSSVARADEPVLVPPRITSSAEPSDPRAAADTRETVELEIDVDAAGAVADVRVVRSGGEALDAAAIEAARRLGFEPATRDGIAIRARIRYEVVFEAKTADAAPVPTDSPAPAALVPPEPPEASEPETFEASARVEAPPREVTRRTLTRDELSSIPGTRGDAIRAIEVLPGVGRPAAGGGLPILRGANPFDTQVYLDGAPVPLLYHLGGLTSFVHGRVIDSVDLYPSNFSPRYGRKVGGVIEAKLRDPRTDGFHGIAELSVLDSSVLVETPLGKKVSALAAVRRSNLDAFLGSFSDKTLAITAAPVYWDYQAIVAWKPTDDDRIRLMGYGSTDSLALRFENPNESDPTVRGAFDSSTAFHRVQVGYRHRFRGGSEENTELTYGHGTETGAFGAIGRFRLETHTAQLRSEWALVASRAVRFVAGIDALANNFRGTYEGPPPPPPEGEEPVSISSQRRVDVKTSAWSVTPGAYLEAGLRPIPELLVSPGVRADYDDLIGRAALDPRLSVRLDATETTAFKAGVGRFSQSPELRHVVLPIGNPALRMTQAVHASVGVEQKIGDSVSASVDVFGKWLDGVVTNTPGGAAPYFVNDQEGRIFGGELMLRVRPNALGGRFSGFLSYTLMRSERRDRGDADYRLFDRDQTHILAATGMLRLGRGWETGAAVRVTSGTPFTPVTSSVYDGSTDVYSPRVGRAMSMRNPAFSRVDLRLQKTWTFSAWSFAAYLDVQNVLNAENREGFEYSYDYRSRQGLRGLPILPILGLRGEL